MGKIHKPDWYVFAEKCHRESLAQPERGSDHEDWLWARQHHGYQGTEEDWVALMWNIHRRKARDPGAT